MGGVISVNLCYIFGLHIVNKGLRFAVKKQSTFGAIIYPGTKKGEGRIIICIRPRIFHKIIRGDAKARTKHQPVVQYKMIGLFKKKSNPNKKIVHQFVFVNSS